MSINSVSMYSPNVNFRSSSSQQQYENPINRTTERNLAILSSAAISGFAGVVAGGATKLFFSSKGYKWPLGVGLVTALAALGLTLPPKIYNTKVSAYTREKEMDVFSRQKSAQNNIYEGINDEIKNDEVALDDKINHYATVKMADNGNGVMIKGV